MYISNQWDTQYNNSITLHTKDTTDVNLIHTNYNTLFIGHKNLMIWTPPPPKTVNIKSVLISRQQQFPSPEQNTLLAALNPATIWLTNKAVCKMLICYRWSTTQSPSWPSPPCTLRWSPSQWTFTGQTVPPGVRHRPQLTGKITPAVQLTDRLRLQTLPKSSLLWPARSTTS